MREQLHGEPVKLRAQSSTRAGQRPQRSDTMKVQVFGTACAACTVMKRNVDTAVAELGLDCTVEHVTRILDMIDHGVGATPALAIDGDLKVVGRALDVPAIKELLSAASRRDGVTT